VGKARVNNERQPTTPPSTGRPIAKKHKRTNTAPVISNYERFDNEKAKNSVPMAKKVNKFLRKAVLVKNLSLGQHIPSSKTTKDKRSSSPIEDAAASTSGTAAAAVTPAISQSSTAITTENKRKSAPASFLRKAVLVKSLSLGQHIPSSKMMKDKRTSSRSSTIETAAASATAAATAVTPQAMVVTPQSSTAIIKENRRIRTKQKSAPANVSPTTSETSTMAQDLLEISESFVDLQIPSLQAKIAPTSFLTGKGNETVTTNCSNEPTPFQLEIPSLSEVVTMARLNEFVENYRMLDQNLDMQQFVGLTRMQLQHKIDISSSINNTSTGISSGISSGTMVKEHVPIVQSLLDCAAVEGEDISIQGFVTESGDLPADSRAEAVVFQGQRNFTVVFRGTTEQQSKVLGSSRSKKKAVPLDNSNNSTIEVYSGFLETYSRVEEDCFRLIDKLVDENPFCDVVFSGYSFGAAMATLAAMRYATARPTMRVGCLTLATPKVGFSHFKQIVNLTPNLKVMRLELGGTETKCRGPTVGGWHAGHTLVLNHHSNSSSNSNSHINIGIGNGSGHARMSGSPSRSGSPAHNNGGASSFEKKQPSVSVYKFEAPKHKNGGFFKTSNPGLKNYISTLEELATLQNNSDQKLAVDGKQSSSSTPPSTWPKDFANNAGKGVVINNEKRLVV